MRRIKDHRANVAAQPEEYRLKFSIDGERAYEDRAFDWHIGRTA